MSGVGCSMAAWLHIFRMQLRIPNDARLRDLEYRMESVNDTRQLLQAFSDWLAIVIPQVKT